MSNPGDPTNLSVFMSQLVKSLRFLRDEMPLVITNTDTPNIHKTMTDVLVSPELDSLYLSVPYISEYFVSVMRKTTVKSVFVLIDRSPEDYVVSAMESLLQYGREKNVEVNVVQRPKEVVNPNNPNKTKKTAFLHQKIMVPLYKNQQWGLYPACAFAGSVNFTANGIKNNDEALVVLRNRDAIIKCLHIIFERAIESKNVV